MTEDRDGRIAASRGAGGCAICGRPVEPRWRPFCSKRCADIDLGRWLGERYVVPDGPGAEDEERPEGETPEAGR